MIDAPTGAAAHLRAVDLAPDALAETLLAVPLPLGVHRTVTPGPGPLELTVVLASSADAAGGSPPMAPAAALASAVAAHRRALGASCFGEGDALRLGEAAGRALQARGLRVATAESCTGGLVAQQLTAPAGASAWYAGGIVAYANEVKVRLLGVGAATLATHGAVSEATVCEMALGALTRVGAELAVSISGIAGPTGAAPGKPVGTVYFALAWRDPVTRRAHAEPRRLHFGGDRAAVQAQAAAFAVDWVRRRCEAPAG